MRDPIVSVRQIVCIQRQSIQQVAQHAIVVLPYMHEQRAGDPAAYISGFFRMGVIVHWLFRAMHTTKLVVN